MLPIAHENTRGFVALGIWLLPWALSPPWDGSWRSVMATKNMRDRDAIPIHLFLEVQLVGGPMNEIDDKAIDGMQGGSPILRHAQHIGCVKTWP